MATTMTSEMIVEMNAVQHRNDIEHDGQQPLHIRFDGFCERRIEAVDVQQRSLKERVRERTEQQNERVENGWTNGPRILAEPRSRERHEREPE